MGVGALAPPGQMGTFERPNPISPPTPAHAETHSEASRTSAQGFVHTAAPCVPRTGRGGGAAQKQDRPAHRWGRSLPPSRGPSRPGVSLRLGNAKGSVGIRDSAPPPPGPGSGFSCLLSSHHGPRGWTLAAFAPHSPEPSRGFGCPASHLSLGKGLPYRLPREAQPDGAGWGRRSLLGCLQFSAVLALTAATRSHRPGA